MTYELAKKLKDAGWPQTTGIGDYFYAPDGILWQKMPADAHNDEQMTACPTLSELIEACGDGLEIRIEGMTTAIKTTNTLDRELARAKGRTPEEAIIKLWLVLNGECENPGHPVTCTHPIQVIPNANKR